MPIDDLARLRRLWWLPLLVLLLLDLAWPMGIGALWLALDRSHPMMLQALRWGPTALLLGAEIAWLASIWPRLKVGGAYQALLGLQAALPLAWAAAWYVFLGRWAAGHSRSLLYEPLKVLAPLMQLACLAAAFSLRRRERDAAPVAVMASAGLLVMDGGWIGIGLGSVLAWVWKDPLPSELCGEGAAAAKRVSIIGFSLLAGAVVMAVQVIFPRWLSLGGSWDLMGALKAVPCLALGGLAWSGMGARMGARDRALTGCAWILILVGLPLMLAVLFLIALMGGARF